jgi:methionyl-tRNA formyltransferase
MKRLLSRYSFLSRFVYKKNNDLLNFCHKKDIPYFFIAPPRRTAFFHWVQSLNPDLIVVYRIAHLLDKTIFSLPKYGTINLHPSLLPKYRGPNPYLWTYYNFEKIGGVTVHYIDEGSDTGDIISQKEILIPLGIPLHILHEFLVNQIGANLLLSAIDSIECGTVSRTPQMPASPTMYARLLRKGESKTFINWMEWDVQRIWHILHGYSEIYDFLSFLDLPPFGYKTVPEGYILCDVEEKERGTISLSSDNLRCFSGINGKIFYRYKFSFTRALLTLCIKIGLV